MSDHSREFDCAECGRHIVQMIANAVAAMCSDLQAHPELGCSDTLMLLGMKYIMDGDEAGVRRWIEG